LQRHTLLQMKEQAMTLRQKEIELRKKEVRKREKALEKEMVKVSDQDKRVKKLERQGKRQEERIEKAQQLQYQVNEHFLAVYTTLQFGLKSLSLQTPSRPSHSTRSPLEHVKSSPPPSNSASSPSPQVNHFHSTPIEPLATGYVKPFLKFGKPKVSCQVFVSLLALSNEHSPRDCLPQHENKNDADKLDVSLDNKRNLYQTIEVHETLDDSISNPASSPSEAAPAPSFVESVKLISTKL